MSQLFGFIDNDLIDFFIEESEELRNFGNDFLKVTPDLLCHAQLHGFFGNLPEESTDRFIITEASGHRKDVISDGTDCGVGNLGSEVGALALAKTQILFAVLYDHLQAPSSGVDFPRLEEVQRDVGGQQAVPLTLPASLYKVDPDRHAVKLCIGHDIIRPKLAAVFDLFVLLCFSCKGRGADFSVFCLETGLSLALVRGADLYHSEPMALHMTGFYKPYDVGTGEPAVGQNVFESDLVFDCPPYHLFGKFNLGHPVFALSFLIQIGVSFKTLASLDFLVAEPMIAFLSGFSYQRKIKKELRPAVSYGHKKTFEPEHTFVFKMGIYPADIFHRPAGLVEVRVIYDKAGILTLGVRPHPYLVPQLGGYAPQSLSPGHRRIGDKAVEHIFLSIQENLYRRIFAVENIFDPQIGQQQQALEHGQRPVKSVTLVFDSKCAPFGHPYAGKYACYGLHCFGEFFIVEKIFDFRYKWCNFVYRHGLSNYLCGYLKLLIFCHLDKKPCRFFMPLYLQPLTCET